MIALMEKKGALPSTTHFVRMNDQGNIFSRHYFVAFLFHLSVQRCVVTLVGATLRLAVISQTVLVSSQRKSLWLVIGPVMKISFLQA